MKVKVIRDRCEGNAVCVSMCPEVFEVGEDDVVHLLVDRPDATLRPSIENAVRGCPRQALSIVDG